MGRRRKKHRLLCRPKKPEQRHNLRNRRLGSDNDHSVLLFEQLGACFFSDWLDIQKARRKSSTVVWLLKLGDKIAEAKTARYGNNYERYDLSSHRQISREGG